MYIGQFLILFLAAGAFILALRPLLRQKKTCCTGDCASCACACNQRERER